MRALSSTLVALCLGALPASAAPEPSVFYADAAHTPVTVETDGTALLLNGTVRAWRTGDMALKALDPAVVERVEALPEVAYLEALDASRGLYKVVSEPGVDEIGLSARIAGWDGVAFCHPDLEVELQTHTLNDPLLPQAWHLDNTGARGGLAGVDVGAFEAWETTMGEGQLIAIVDTGIDLAHEDLDLVPGYDFGDDDDDPTPEPEYDGHGHGTAMAGVAAAIGDNGLGTAGIAPKAQILPIKLIGDGGSTVAVAEAFRWSVDQGATVLSNSWGYSAQGCGRIPLPGIIAEAVEYAETEGRGGRGAAVAMSYGNGGCDASQDDFHNDPYIISVGAATDRDERASYSNFGDGLDIMGFGAGNGRPGLWTTDITGEDGYTDNDNDPYWPNASGTSSACASVAGVLALMFAANERLTAADARAVLCETAVKPAWDDAGWTGSGRSRLYGCGRIDAAAAVAVVANDAPSVQPDPVGDQTADQVRLSWTGSDPDGDALVYRVRVWLESDVAEDGTVEETVLDTYVDGEEIDLTDELVPGSLTYQWDVAPVDAWGEGEFVAGGDFLVSPVVEEKGGCSTLSAGSLGGLAGLLGLAALLGRRRREGACGA